MTLAADEFIRRFLLHVLPKGFHRIRHTGLFANGGRTENLALARKLLNVTAPPDQPEPEEADHDDRASAQPCPSCGGTMVVVETFEPGQQPCQQRSRDPPPGQALRP